MRPRTSRWSARSYVGVMRNHVVVGKVGREKRSADARKLRSRAVAMHPRIVATEQACVLDTR